MTRKTLADRVYDGVATREFYDSYGYDNNPAEEPRSATHCRTQR